jgi:hypothetical protein
MQGEGQRSSATSGRAADAPTTLRGSNGPALSLPEISVRGESNGRSNDSSRQLQNRGSYLSVIQSILSALKTIEAETGNSCLPTRPCALCEGDCDTDDDVSFMPMARPRVMLCIAWALSFGCNCRHCMLDIVSFCGHVLLCSYMHCVLLDSLEFIVGSLRFSLINQLIFVKCAGTMRCFHREYPFTAVPGCQGAEKRDDTSDFCYIAPEDAGPNLVENDCEDLGSGACGMCEVS